MKKYHLGRGVLAFLEGLIFLGGGKRGGWIGKTLLV
jgi:hypothetical protein